jgi:hypothetical protein
VSTGCIAISDIPIEEVYILSTQARNQGQEFIPVHVFPVRYNNKKSMDYLLEATKSNSSLQQFSSNIKAVFDYFELKKELPIIMVNRKGEYVIN